MSELTIRRRIDAPREAVFDTLTDARRYPDYTSIRRVEIERAGEGDANGRGAIRALHVVGPPVRERVIAYERARLFSFEVLSGAPMRAYLGTQTFESDGRGTLVSYRIEASPIVPGTGLALVAGLRCAVELLFRLAAREAPRRAAELRAAATSGAQASVS